LVEAMVALVVLSVGMIGIAATYGQSLTAGRAAQLRTHAVNLAADMAERIRANRRAGSAYAGAAANRHCDPQNGPVADCAPADMAAHDVYTWNRQIQALLPEGKGTIAYTDGDPPTYTITLSWREIGRASSDGTAAYATAVQIPEY
jgi:type IV pilus assembly protein PilV